MSQEGVTELELKEHLQMMLEDVLKAKINVELSENADFVIVRAEPVICSDQAIFHVQGEDSAWDVYYIDGDGGMNKVGNGETLVAVAAMLVSVISSYAWTKA